MEVAITANDVVVGEGEGGCNAVLVCFRSQASAVPLDSQNVKLFACLQVAVVAKAESCSLYCRLFGRGGRGVLEASSLPRTCFARR